MQKCKKTLLFLATSLLSAICLTGCSSKDKIVIRVLSAADYIYECAEEGYYCENCGKYIDEDHVSQTTNEDGDEIYIHKDCGEEVYYDMDMMDQFIKYMDDKYKDQGLEFDYVYDTFDTPETCYNEMLMGKSKYDVINVSDYTIQKMVTNGLIQNITKIDHYKEIEGSLHDNISQFLWGEDTSTFNKTHARKKEYSLDDPNPYMEEVISDYAVPYMWGTVGIMWNPSYKGYSNYSVEELMSMFSSWKTLYDEKMQDSFFIKDSVRDTYVVSVIHSFQEDIEKLMEKYHIVLPGETPLPDEDKVGFNREFTVLFNKCDDKTLEIIKADMDLLKDRAFGFEVDSGKTDMVAGIKVGADLCWSGDAAWAIYEAQQESGKELYFTMPYEGSNIWTDAWAVPTNATHPDYALDFIDFMSQEEQAISNMDAVFYTTATATEGVLDYFRDMFDVRDFYNEECSYGDDDDYEEPTCDYLEYDISYFFDGNIDPARLADNRWGTILHSWTYDTEEIYEETEDYTITCSTYARIMPAMLPAQEQLHFLCVMDDYGIQNQKVLEMWQHVRTNALPVWAIILLACEIGAVLAFAVIMVIKQHQYKKNKENRSYKK